MEPDEEVIFQKSLQTYMNHVINDPNAYKIVHTPSSYRHMDLSSVSTRDLLNECYRRRAIERFTYSAGVDSEMLRIHPDMRDRVMQKLVEGIAYEMQKNTKFFSHALDVKERHDSSYMRSEFRGEMYICKHPTKVQK